MKAYWAVGLMTGSMLWCGTVAAAEMHVTRDAYGETRQTAIRADDLDLTRTAGAEELLARIDYAAVRVCDADNMNWDLSLYEQHRLCIKNTMDRTVASVPSPLVQRLYAADVRGDR